MSDRGYTVVGAGAIGGTLAVHLDAAGVAVHLIDSDAEHVAAIRANGLTLRTPDSTMNARLPVWEPAEAPERLERVLLAVKAQATDAAAAWIAPRLAENGFVASLQNGLNEAVIARHVGGERVLAAFVDLFADVVGPGVIKDGGHGAMALGEHLGEPTARVSALAADLRHWGEPVVTENVAGYLWAKLGFGAMLSATALADDTMADLIDRHRPGMNALVAEVFAIADAVDVRLEGFDAFYPDLYRRGADPDANTDATDHLVAWLRTQSKDRSGIWRDLVVRRRPTEVPAQYRPVLELGAEHGIATPLLEWLLSMIDGLERGTISMSEDHLAELDRRAQGQA